MKNIINIENVSKVYKWEEKYKGFGKIIKSVFKPQYRTLNALDKVSLTVKSGEIVGLLGPNGAGKSTLFKCMTGILKVDLGKIDIFGQDIWKNRKKINSEIGAFFGNKGLMWWNLPVIKSYELIKEIYHISDEDFNARLEFYMNIIGDSEYLSKPPRQLSYGQRQRAELITCLLHNPKIVFLDEPTLGLDIVAKEQLTRMILETNRVYGTTFVISTHDLKDIEEMCSRVVIINKGKIVKDSDAKCIKDELQNNYVLEIDFKSEIDMVALREVISVFDVITNKSIKIKISSSDINVYELLHMINGVSEISTFRIDYQTIDEVIRKYY